VIALLGSLGGARAEEPAVEVGDLPPLAQVKLLRALQEGEVKRVGSNETKIVDVRVIAATNVDLKDRIAAGRFREDLYYRLNVVAIALPPLRERPEDVPLLAYHFLQKYATRSNSPVRKIAADAMRILQGHRWQGNVRELENAIEHAVVFCRDVTITVSDLPFSKKQGPSIEPAAEATASISGPPLSPLVDLPYREAKDRAVHTFETAYFGALLQRAGGNVSEAARQAGLDRSNFRRAARRAGVKMRDED